MTTHREKPPGGLIIRNRFIYLYLLIRSSHVVPDLHWVVHHDVEVAAGVEYCINIYE